MIDSDKGKPMTFMEYITDEPRDLRPYLDYAIKNVKGRRDYWKEQAVGFWMDCDANPIVARVVANLDWALHFLEDAAMKLDREIRERAQTETPK